MSSIASYKIHVPDDAVQELSQRLSYARFPDQLDGDVQDPWDFGTPLNDVKRLTEYWRHGFDWRKAEEQMNELPNFMTQIDIDGFGKFDVHFLHEASPVKNAIPMLFCHGWPGNFLEVTKLLPLLSGSTDGPVFHIVAPSLPNFGFSSGTNKKGFTLTKYAETLHKLMLKLGYNEYVTQGGDWGYSITRAIGLLYPDHCKASHLNMILALQPTFSKHPILALTDAVTSHSRQEKEGLKRSAWFNNESYGYNTLQSTKPQTISYALADSPVTLLAWIYEKLHDWSDHYAWTDDEVLNWVSLYWFSTAGPQASVRIYHESTHPQPQSDVSVYRLRKWIPHVKLGLSYFPGDITVVPKLWGKTLGPVVYQSRHGKGGHFAATEVPEILAQDLKKMFGKNGPCFGVIGNKNGYR